MSRYIPTPSYPDSMPVDISFVFADEKPAGKHGFLKPQGEIFVFEDGTPARFWGVNFNGGANFPEHAYAEKVARRLAQSGCNIVRFHQLDAEWDTPNIYAYTKGRRMTNSRDLDPVSMDHLDYLIHCLKEEGIYVYFDMMTYRKFKSGDGVAHAEELYDSAKPYSIFDPRMIELQKEFCDKIWNRFNPYTGLYYKDDPVFVMTEITNECDLFSDFKAKRPSSPYYDGKMRELFGAWLQEKGIEYDWQNCDLYENTDTVLDFKMDITQKYYHEMYDHLRSLGVKFPITGTNWTHQHAANTAAEKDMDFVDAHNYYYNWGWGEDDKFVDSRMINGTMGCMFNPATQNLKGKPFVISEWDMPWPNPFRAESPIYYAAVASLQNWSGMIIHTYAYGTQMDRFTLLGKEVSSSCIGGIPYREGIFSVWNDPAKFGLFYHSALMLRRQDITPAVKRIGVRPDSRHKIFSEAQKTGLERHNLKVVLDGMDTSDLDEVISAKDAVSREDPKKLVSDNGQMWRLLDKQVGGIDTPRTKVIYGKLTSGRAVNAKAMPETQVDGFKVEAKTDFAVVALSSLTNDPIETSDNMLLSTIGRAHNHNSVFDGDKMLEYGEPPIESEVIQAKLTIRTNRTDLKVWGVNAEGYYVGALPVKFENGQMSFTVGENKLAIYYLIIAE